MAAESAAESEYDVDVGQGGSHNVEGEGLTRLGVDIYLSRS